MVAVFTKPAGGPGTFQYLHYDHLDSVDVVTTATGQVVERLSYDAFGKRRNANWLNDTADQQLKLPHATDRGYTSQEQLDGVGLIHYGGRVYDPILGRFTSADPFVQAPTDVQSYNRYAYVRNNPLSLTDPSGFFSVRKWVKKNSVHIVGAMTGGLGYLSLAGADHQVRNSKTWRTVYGVGAATFGGPLGAGAYAGYVTKRMGGTWQQALRNSVVATAASLPGEAVGAHYGNSWSPGRVLASSVAGGVSSELQGGSFRDGFRISFVVASLTFANVKMREAMIEQSKINPDNISGESEGLNGDGYKLAGARRVFDENGSPLRCWSPFGGCQGAPIGLKDQRSNFLGLEYAPGSALDHANEAFAGPHDFFRSLTGAYDRLGNGVTGAGFFQDWALNVALLFPAAPFAVATMVSPTAYSTLTQPWKRY